MNDAERRILVNNATREVREAVCGTPPAQRDEAVATVIGRTLDEMYSRTFAAGLTAGEKVAHRKVCTLTALRNANLVRDVEWNSAAERISIAWRANEFAGELGELANLVKKIARVRMKLKHAPVDENALLSQAADELADVLICLDLLAMDLGLNTRDILLKSLDSRKAPHGIERMSLSYVSASLVATAYYIVCMAERIEALQLGLASPGPSKEDQCIDFIRQSIPSFLSAWVVLGAMLKIDWRQAIPAKFNATSQKHGLATMMEAPAA